MKNRLNILQVSTADRGGGAEKVAWDLFRSYPAYGHGSWLASELKKTDHPMLFPSPAMPHAVRGHVFGYPSRKATERILEKSLNIDCRANPPFEDASGS